MRRRTRQRPGVASPDVVKTTTEAINGHRTAGTVTALRPRRWRADQAARRAHLEALAAETVEILVVAIHGTADLDDAIFEAHRMLNLAVIDLCKNGAA